MQALHVPLCTPAQCRATPRRISRRARLTRVAAASQHGEEPTRRWAPLLGALVAAGNLALPASDAMAAPSPAPSSTSRLSQPASALHPDVVLGQVDDLSALCQQLCSPKALAQKYPTSVKVLLSELRDKSDELRRMRLELAATQQMLYASQGTIEEVQAAKWKELGIVATSCVGLAAGLRTYAEATIGQIEREKKRALVDVEVQVQHRLQGALAEKVEERVAVRLADAVEQEIPTTVATLREEQVARMKMQEALDAERAAAREALKQERAEKAVALARAQELKRQQGIANYQLMETKRTLEAEQEAHRQAEVERRLARVIIEARQAAKTERAVERVRAEAALAAERELSLQRIVMDAQERRALELRKEADDYRQEAARVQQTLDDMAGSTQDQINVLQTRVEQASALRSAADADYKDISAQLQNERFRVETLMKQVEQAAADRHSQGADAGSLYQQLADQLEAEHEKVSVLEAQLETAAVQRAELNSAYLDAIEDLHLERTRVAALQRDLQQTKSDLLRSEQEVGQLRAASMSPSSGTHSALSFSDAEVALLQNGLHALAKQSSLHEGEANGLMALPGHVASLAEEVASLAEEMASLAEETRAEAAAGAEVVAGHDLESSEEEMVFEEEVEEALPAQVAEMVLDGHVILFTPGSTAAEEPECPAEVPVAWLESEAAVVDEAAAVEEETATVVEEDALVAEQPQEAATEEAVEQQMNHIVSIGQHASSNGHSGTIQLLSYDSSEPLEAAPQSTQAPPQFSFWEQQNTDVIPRTMVREWTDPRFAASTLAAFPEKAVANAEEARCLVERGGYVWLDVRPSLELADVGSVPGSFNIPVMHAEWVDGEGERRVAKTRNEAFIDQVSKHFPQKDTPLLVGCSDGCTYSIDALEALEDAGYSCLVGIKGGFHAWQRVFDEAGDRLCQATGGALAADAQASAT